MTDGVLKVGLLGEQLGPHAAELKLANELLLRLGEGKNHPQSDPGISQQCGQPLLCSAPARRCSRGGRGPSPDIPITIIGRKPEFRGRRLRERSENDPVDDEEG